MDYEINLGAGRNLGAQVRQRCREIGRHVPIIDMHAHLTPERYKEAIRAGNRWHGLDGHAGRLNLNEGFNRSIDERISDMNASGIDMQVLSPTVGFYQYKNTSDTAAAIARDCNQEIAETVDSYPDRFLGVATLPMQDVSLAIGELTRAIRDLSLKGAMISDHVNGLTYDHPDFLPFFQAAEELGAILLLHQGHDTCVTDRIDRYKLPNAVGNLTERALSFGAIVFGGVADACPDLKLLFAHGGGFAPYGIARMDKVSGALEPHNTDQGLRPLFAASEGENELRHPPSTYLARFYYDSCTYSASVLRFLIDTVGIDKIVLGTDYPAPMMQANPVKWIRSMDRLTSDEKDQILSKNANVLLGL